MALKTSFCVHQGDDSLIIEQLWLHVNVRYQVHHRKFSRVVDLMNFIIYEEGKHGLSN
jgi:hypothetical protein